MEKPSSEEIRISPNQEKISEAIDKLESKRKEKIEEVKIIQNASQNLGYIQSYWLTEPKPSNLHDFTILASGCSAIDGLSTYIVNLTNTEFQGKGLYAINTSASTIATAITYLEDVSLPTKVTERYEQQKKKHFQQSHSKQSIVYVRSKLEVIDKQIVEIFDGVWSSLEIGDENSIGKAASSMKDVITHVIKFYAPDEKVKNQPNFVPCKDSQNGISRKQRYLYISSNLIKDVKQKSLFESSIDLFVETHDVLNKSHYPKSIDILREKIYNALSNLEMIFRIL